MRRSDKNLNKFLAMLENHALFSIKHNFEQGNNAWEIIDHKFEALGMTHASLVQLTQLAHSGDHADIGCPVAHLKDPCEIKVSYVLPKVV